MRACVGVCVCVRACMHVYPCLTSGVGVVELEFCDLGPKSYPSKVFFNYRYALVEIKGKALLALKSSASTFYCINILQYLSVIC